MADQEWYYSHGDEEQGPVSAARLKKLIGQGKVSASDLVWHDGMDDWTRADQVTDLIAVSTEASKAMATPKPSGTKTGDYGRKFRTVLCWLETNPRATTQGVLVLGLVMVITSRGCDGLGTRNAQRLKAKYEIATQRFDDDWETRSLEIQAQIAQLNDRQQELQDDLRERRRSGETIGAEDLKSVNDQLAELAKAVEKYQQQTSAMRDKKQRERQTLSNGNWRSLKIAARDADASDAVWAYWRGVAFVMGSVLLTVGLVFTGFRGEGAERWICLTMLAIIVFSLYVVGVPWIGLRGIVD